MNDEREYDEQVAEMGQTSRKHQQDLLMEWTCSERFISSSNDPETCASSHTNLEGIMHELKSKITFSLGTEPDG